MRTRLLGVVFAVVGLSGCAGSAPVDDNSTPLLLANDEVTARDVCFTVNNVGDPLPSTITGTLFTNSTFDANTRVVLMMHGAVSTRQFMDGLGNKKISLARNIAQRGYAVVTIDRLGFGQSPYDRPLGGRLLTFDSYVETAHQVISQLHAGSYTIAAGACPTGVPATVASRSVILLGHSFAGGITQNYAGRYHDIDAAVAIAWTNQGIPSTVMNFFVETVIPTCAIPTNDYTYFFQPGTNGLSQECLNGTTYPAGIDPSVANTFCANANLLRSPCGELTSAPDMQAANMAVIPFVGSTPVLLGWGDFDNFVTNATWHGPSGTDSDLVTPEVNYWQANCGCDVSTLWQSNTGHAEPLHNSVFDFAKGVVTWLASRNLPPRL